MVATRKRPQKVDQEASEDEICPRTQARSTLKRLFRKMRRKKWGLVPRSRKEAEASNSLNNRLNIDYEDLMIMLLVAGLAEKENKRKAIGYDSEHRINGTKMEEFIKNEFKPFEFQYLARRPVDQQTQKRLSTCYFISHGMTDVEDRRPVPLFRSRKRDLEMITPALRPVKHGRSTMQQVHEVRKNAVENATELAVEAAVRTAEGDKENHPPDTDDSPSPHRPRKLLRQSLASDVGSARYSAMFNTYNNLRDQLGNGLNNPVFEPFQKRLEEFDDDELHRVTRRSVAFGLLDDNKTEVQKQQIVLMSITCASVGLL